MPDVVFVSKLNIVQYIYANLDNPEPLKIQCSLYFLWAYYSATYGCMDIEQSENKGSGISYPKELFKACFSACQYGPIDYDVWLYTNNHLLNKQVADFSHLIIIDLPCVVNDMQLFIDSILKQINQVNVFGLVNRTHQDLAWQTAYQSDNKIMNNEDITRDYIKYVAE